MDMKQVGMPTSPVAVGTTGAQSLGTPVALRPWLRELRAHQWLKNLLVFVPLLTSHEFGLLAKVLAACVAFAAFSCTASATYIFNDILDIKNDRAHPRKYARPIAANIISVRAGVLATVLLAGTGLTLSIALPRAYLLVLLAYALVAVAYSLKLKRLLLVDILALAVLYALRIIAGAYAIDVLISSWLIVFSIFIFFSLALVKRCAELVALERSGGVGHAPGRNYLISDLNVLWPLGVGSSLCAIVVFGLFVFSVQAEGQYASPSVLWLCGVALIYWTARLWVKTSRGEMHDDPLVFAMRDRGSSGRDPDHDYPGYCRLPRPSSAVMDASLAVTDRRVQAAFALSVALTVALTATWSISAVGLLIGLPIGRWQAVLGASLTALTLYLMTETWQARVVRCALVLGVLALAAGISITTVDDGYDGWLYHEPGVIGLAHGWNPVWQPRFDTWWSAHGASLGNAPGAPFVDGLWTTAYPKANWILAANAVVWGLPLDAGKYAGILLIVAAAGVAWRSLLLAGLPLLPAAVLAATAALNPIAVMQTTTYYVDGPLASCLCLLVFAALAFSLTASWLDLLLVACAALLACNLKFTGPLYVALLLLPSVALWLRHRRMSWQHGRLVICASLLLLLCSVNPYLTNIRVGGSPVQPLNRINVMQGQIWPEFLNKNRLEKLAISLTFSNAFEPYGELAEPVARSIATPFQQRSLAEFTQFATSYDLRIGGFGPLFGLTLLLTLILWVWPGGRVLGEMPFAALAAGIVLATLSNPEAWWARYAPQLWLLPILAAAAAFRARSGRLIALVISCAIAFASTIAICGRAVSAAMTTMQYETALHRAGSGPLLVKPSNRDNFFIPTLAYRLRERGTSLHVSQASCTHPIRVIVMQVCPS